MHKNEYLNLIEAYVASYGLYGFKIPDTVCKHLAFGNIKHWTQHDWDDMAEDPWNWYLYTEITEDEYIIHIFRRPEVRNVGHPKYITMKSATAELLTMNCVLGCRHFLYF